MPLDISVTEIKPDTVRVGLNGSLDSETYTTLEGEMKQIPDSVKFLIFDMKHLEFISSAGLRVVFATLKRFKAKGGSVGVSNMSPNVKKVFEIVRALPSLTVFANDKEMDDYLSKFQ